MFWADGRDSSLMRSSWWISLPQTTWVSRNLKRRDVMMASNSVRAVTGSETLSVGSTGTRRRSRQDILGDRHWHAMQTWQPVSSIQSTELTKALTTFDSCLGAEGYHLRSHKAICSKTRPCIERSGVVSSGKGKWAIGNCELIFLSQFFPIHVIDRVNKPSKR
jgi:hypothetical protein